MTKPYHTSNRDDWETPAAFFKKLDEELHFTWDVCASEENTKHEHFFSRSANGLTCAWGGLRCWMNPPYSFTQAWIVKAYNECASHRTFYSPTLVAALVASRTDTVWWQQYVLGPHTREIRFVRGRLKFEGAPYSAPFPSAVIIFDSRVPRDWDIRVASQPRT
jgi:phage N-6-adenine-methyltransferase